MARQARMLKMPESDPAWENVRYRSTAPVIPTSVPAPLPMTASNSTRPSTSTQAETKRSTIMDIKLKPKQDAPRAKGEIQMKDESTKATVHRVNTIKRVEAEQQAASSAVAVARKRSGCDGYLGPDIKQKGHPSSLRMLWRNQGHPWMHAQLRNHLFLPLCPKNHPLGSAGGTHARKPILTMPPKGMKKEDESDRERDREYERQKEREREKREREKEKQREEWERERDRVEVEKREKARPQREATEREKRQREKQREREELEEQKRQRERSNRERGSGW